MRPAFSDEGTKLWQKHLTASLLHALSSKTTREEIYQRLKFWLYYITTRLSLQAKTTREESYQIWKFWLYYIATTLSLQAKTTRKKVMKDERSDYIILPLRSAFRQRQREKKVIQNASSDWMFWLYYITTRLCPQEDVARRNWMMTKSSDCKWQTDKQTEVGNDEYLWLYLTITTFCPQRRLGEKNGQRQQLLTVSTFLQEGEMSCHKNKIKTIKKNWLKSIS